MSNIRYGILVHYLYRKRFIYDTRFIFYQSIVHGQQISTTVDVILEKGTSHYYLLNIVV